MYFPNNKGNQNQGVEKIDIDNIKNIQEERIDGWE